MEGRVAAALAKFDEGYDCSHAVLSACADLFETAEGSVASIQRPCGPMTGRPYTVCGAVAGALKALNHALREHDRSTPTMSRSETMLEFRRRFEELHGSVSCADLVASAESQISGGGGPDSGDTVHAKCALYVADSVRILEELLDQ